MLAFTPEVRHAIDWFHWTHEHTAEGWRRRDLPDASRGGLAGQDARLMLLLEEIRRHANRVGADRIEHERQARDLATWRTKRIGELNDNDDG